MSTTGRGGCFERIVHILFEGDRSCMPSCLKADDFITESISELQRWSPVENL